MAMNPYVGWGVSTLLCWFLNKSSDSNEQTSSKPNELSVNETKIGTPIPVVMGRTFVKSPLVIYYGDFRADAYTETYAAHANFSAWPLILSTLLELLTKPKTGNTVEEHTHAGYKGNTGPNKPNPIPTKEKESGKYLMLLAQWLLMWLINGRNLKTTMQKGFKYYLGYQMLVCWSNPGMRIRGIYLDENKIWEGDESREAHQDSPFVINVNNDELFGGPDEGGGFVGDIRVYLGGRNQPADEWMQKQMQADSIDQDLRGLTPAYRPFVSLVVPTAYIGKNATIPTTWLDMQFCPNRLGLGAIGDDANPAEVLYELHVNTDWGLAESPDLIDTEALKAVGEKLSREQLGITVQLTSKEQARALVNSICEHINAVRYIDPATGKLVYKLIRDDYDISTLLRVNEKNCSKLTFTRLDWSETISEISVTYTDRKDNYEQSSISDNDPANIAINEGTKTTKSYSYPYFTNATNALWAAKRENKQQGYPLASISIEGNRTLSSVRTGEVLLLDWEPYGIKNMLIRVTDVDIGDFIEGKVKIEAIEDVFGLEKTNFDFSGSTGWKKDPIYPSGVQTFGYIEMPWELLPSKDSHVFAMAAKPDEKTQRWSVWRQQSGHNWESTSGMSKWTAAGRLVYDYDEFTDAEDLLGFEITDLGGIKELNSAVLADGTPDIVSARRGGKVLVIDDELMAYSSLFQLPNGHWRIKGILRGIFDTVPKAHSAEAAIFFLQSGTYSNVTTGGPVTTEGNTTTEEYNITTATVDAEEAFDYVKVKSLKTCRRPERPNPPGRIRMSAYGVDNATHIDSVDGDLKVSWVNRNKQFSFGCVSQDDVIEFWTGQEFTLPDNLEYVIRVFVGSKLVANHKVTSPYIYSWAQRCLDSRNFVDKTRLEICSKVGELESYQVQERIFTWNIPMIIDGCENEDEAKSKIAEWGVSDKIIIPAGHISDVHQIFYVDMPIIVLGKKIEKTTPPAPNAIACQDGSFLIPNGQLLVVNSLNAYQLISMDAGYIFGSWFVPTATGGRFYYQWDGNKISETRLEGNDG